MRVDGDAHGGERGAKVTIAVQRNDATRLIVINFNAEEFAAMDGTLVFDLETVLKGGFEGFKDGEVGADDENVVDVRGEERENTVKTTEVDAGIAGAAGEAEGEDETVEENSKASRSLFETYNDLRSLLTSLP